MSGNRLRNNAIVEWGAIGFLVYFISANFQSKYTFSTTIGLLLIYGLYKGTQAQQALDELVAQRTALEVSGESLDQWYQRMWDFVTNNAGRLAGTAGALAVTNMMPNIPAGFLSTADRWIAIQALNNGNAHGNQVVSLITSFATAKILAVLTASNGGVLDIEPAQIPREGAELDRTAYVDLSMHENTNVRFEQILADSRRLRRAVEADLRWLEN